MKAKQNLLWLLLLCNLYSISNHAQAYSTDIFETTGSKYEEGLDMSCTSCDGKQIVVSKISGGGIEQLSFSTHTNGILLNTSQFPSASNPTQYVFDNDVHVEPIFNNSSVCEGYIIAFSAKISGTSLWDTHLLKLDPNLNLIWHNTPFTNNGQSTFVKDLIIENNAAVLLTGLQFSSTVVSRFFTSTGNISSSQEIQVFDNGTVTSSPAAIIALPSSLNYAGAYAVVGTSSQKTFIAFLSPTFAINDMYKYSLDDGVAFGNNAVSVAAKNGTIYISGIISYFSGTGAITYTYLLDLVGTIGFVPLGEVLGSRYYAIPTNGTNVKDMQLNASHDGLIMAGQTEIPETGFVIGQFGTPFMMEVDLNGSINWLKDYNTDVSYEGILEKIDVSNSNICACGSQWYNPSSGDENILNIKTLPDGSIQSNCERDINGSITNFPTLKTPLNYANQVYNYTNVAAAYSNDNPNLIQNDCYVDNTSTCAASPAFCLTNTLNISTGFNPITNSVLPTSTSSVASQDPGWILCNAPTNNGPVNLNSPAFVIPTNGSWNEMPPTASPPSRYISAFQSTTNNAGNSGAGAIPYLYKRQFCICEDNTTITITSNIHVDNRVKLSLTGTGLATPVVIRNINTTSTSWFLNPPENNTTIITLNQGTYYLEAEHRNDNPNSAMGLNIEATVVADKNSLVSEACCNAGSFVSGYKYLDNNCDGIYNSGDQLGIGWTIHLRNLTGQILQTAVTDINGYYSFNIQTPGTYRIDEDEQGGYDQNIPTGSQPYTVTVTGYDVFSNLDFYNCPCTYIVGSTGPPAFIDYGQQIPIGIDLAYFNNEIITIEEGGNTILQWNTTTSSWDIVYTHTSTLDELTVFGSQLFFGGENPGYFTNNFINPPTLNPAAIGTDIVYDYENVNGTLFAAGSFNNGAGVYNIAIVMTIGGIGFNPLPFSFTDGIVYEIGWDNSNSIYAIGDFLSYDDIVQIPLSGPNQYIPQPLGAGITINSLGLYHYFDIQEYNGQIHICGHDEVIGVTNTNHYAIYDPSTSSWLPNTGTSGGFDVVYDLDVYGGYLYLAGQFNDIATNSIVNAAIYDGTDYKTLGTLNPILHAVLYAPNYKNNGDRLALIGESPFYLGECGGFDCYAEIYDQEACENEFIQFQSYSYNSGTCLWDFGDGNTSTLCQPFHAYTTSGSYNVTMQHDDGNGCIVTASCTVTIGTPVDASFTYTTNGLGLVVFPVINTMDQWNYGDGSAITTVNFRNYTTPGIYSVCHEVFNSGCRSEYCEQIQVCQPIINLSGVIPDGIYHADDIINVSGSIPAGGNVTVKAGNTINLDPGFIIDPTATFNAIIEPCNN